MNPLRRVPISSVVAAAVAVSAIALWLSVDPAVPVAARLPTRDDLGEATSGDYQPVEPTLLVGSGSPAAIDGTWSGFRGDRRDNIVWESTPLRRTFDGEGPPGLWEVGLGEGYAGAAVRNGRVYVLDYDQEAEADALRCLSLADGREIWRHTYPVVIKRNHGMSRTIPAVTDRYVVALGPMNHLSCVDTVTGECLWMRDLNHDFGAEVPQWYTGQCPLIDNDRVVVAPGGPDALLVTLDPATGEVIWSTPNPRDWTMTHSSIMRMTLGEMDTYVYCGKGGVVGVDASDGRILWETTKWKIGIATCPSPLVLPEDKIFFCGGYGAGAMLMRVVAADDPDGYPYRAEVVAQLKTSQFDSTQQTPVFYEDHIYGVRSRDDQLVCLDLEAQEVWSSGRDHRFGDGDGPYLLADGLLHVLDDAGHMTLVEATPEAFRPVASYVAIDEANQAWGPMALVDGRLLVRDLTRMRCLDVAQ